MRIAIAAILLLFAADAAAAQLTAANTGSAADTTSAYQKGPDIDVAPKAADEGRFVANARDGLTGRGGAADTGRTYGGTIGSSYSATIGSTIGTSLPLSQPR